MPDLNDDSIKAEPRSVPPKQLAQVVAAVQQQINEYREKERRKAKRKHQKKARRVNR